VSQPSLNAPSPANRRALFLAVIAVGLLAAVAVFAQSSTPPRPAPEFISGDTADQAEGRRALEEFRAAGIVGMYWLEFELRVLPRKGAERSLRGQIFGTRNAQGPLTRLSLAQPNATPAWLIQSGPQPSGWLAPAIGAATQSLSVAETLAPIAGTDLTPFDLQMPFLYWNDFAYEGVAKIRSRPAYSFLLYPPADIAAVRPDLGAVRVALDTQFHALVQAEFIDPKGDALKSITVLELKQIGEQWLVKSIDVRNRTTRHKTRFEVTAAALDLVLPDKVFSPEALGEAAILPAGAKAEKF
jgi:Outer membrane lipoprotein-sorting protein